MLRLVFVKEITPLIRALRYPVPEIVPTPRFDALKAYLPKGGGVFSSWTPVQSEARSRQSPSSGCSHLYRRLEQKTLWRQRCEGRPAFGPPNQGVRGSFCCWIACLL